MQRNVLQCLFQCDEERSLEEDTRPPLPSATLKEPAGQICTRLPQVKRELELMAGLGHRSVLCGKGSPVGHRQWDRGCSVPAVPMHRLGFASFFTSAPEVCDGLQHPVRSQ